MNFVRVNNPLRAIKIGVITWNNMDPSVEPKIMLKRKGNQVPIYTKSRNPVTVFGFCSDGRNNDTTIFDRFIEVKSIERFKIKKTPMILLEFELKGEGSKKGLATHLLEGPVERFKKYFEIIQQR